MKEREEDFRQMHETMIKALNSETPDKNVFKKELDFATQLHDREKGEMKNAYEENKKIYDRQIIEMREQMTSQESMIKDLEYKKREVEMQAEANEARFRKEKGDLIEQLNKALEDNEQIKELAQDEVADIEQRV